MSFDCDPSGFRELNIAQLLISASLCKGFTCGGASRPSVLGPGVSPSANELRPFGASRPRASPSANELRPFGASRTLNSQHLMLRHTSTCSFRQAQDRQCGRSATAKLSTLNSQTLNISTLVLRTHDLIFLTGKKLHPGPCTRVKQGGIRFSEGDGMDFPGALDCGTEFFFKIYFTARQKGQEHGG